MEPGKISTAIKQIVENVERVIIGKRDKIELLAIALLCEGHVLIEDVPGLGKTMLARSMAASIGGEFKRLQCTPDLLPNDVTGVSIFNQKEGYFEFVPGPVFVNILLADEINRATPRTQSALLEAMQEQQVSVDGVTRNLPRPFMVIATQNPIEFEGTFPLPEAQLDRFLIKVDIGYPSHLEERRLLNMLQREHPVTHLEAVIDTNILEKLQREVWEVFIEESLQDYIVSIIRNTRNHPDILLGASPRGSLALSKTSQAYAAINGRDHVIPDDIQALTSYVLQHRLILKPESELRGRTAKKIIQEIVEQTPLELSTDFG